MASSRSADFLPSLNLTPCLGVNAFRPGVLLNPQSLALGVLGGLAAPVFNRRLPKGNLRVAEAQSREAYYAYQRAIVTGVSEVVNHLSGLVDLYQTLGRLAVSDVFMMGKARLDVIGKVTRPTKSNQRSPSTSQSYFVENYVI